MNKEDVQYKDKMKENAEKLSDAAKEKAKKEMLKKIITVLGAKGIAILILIVLLTSILTVIFLAVAVNYDDWDRKNKATSAKESSIGNEALNTIITMEDGKYKIKYKKETGEELTGKKAIEAILEDNNMNFEDFSEEEIECLYKCLKAEWATTYPNLGEDVDNKDIDGEYVQGVVTIKRGKSDGSIVNLTYKTYEEFSKIKDMTALDYFSMKDGNIIVANWNSTETIYTPSDGMPDDIKSQYVNTGEQISIVETAINYRSMIGIHTVPFEFLLSLLVNTEDVEFVSELADVAFDSKIEFTVYDNLTEIIDIAIEETKEDTTYEKWIDYVRTKTIETTSEGNTRKQGPYVVERDTHNFKSSEEKHIKYTLTTKTITKNNSYVVGLTNISSWLADVKDEYKYSSNIGKEKNLDTRDPVEYTRQQDKEIISNGDSEVVEFKKSKEGTSTTVDRDTGATITTTYACNIKEARRQGTLKGKNTLTKNTTQTNEYKYESAKKQTDKVGTKFKEVYDKHVKAQAQLDNVASWLFELLEDTNSTVDYVSIMKYLLYVCTGTDYGVTELNLSIYDQSEFITIGYGIYDGKTPLDAFLLAWEGTKKDANGNFVLHRPTDVTIGYGLYLKYNLDLFQNLGYFKGINQSTWESTLYQNRKQRVINGSDIKFYDYSMENGSLKRGAQIPNEKIEEACQNSRANMRQAVIDQLKKANITLTDNQIDALTIVKYKWGNIGNFTSVYHYYKEGDKDKFLNSFYVSGVHPMQKAYRLDERQYAAWLIFDQGKYIDRSGNEIILSTENNIISTDNENLATGNTKFWWPIGSKVTTIENGITFAKGAPSTTHITSNYGPRWGKMHKGIDVGGYEHNLIAIADGIVKAIYYRDNGYHINYASYSGNTSIYIEHSNGIISEYLHMKSGSIPSIVQVGQKVYQGQVIGLTGYTGYTVGSNNYGAHLHFGIITNGRIRSSSKYDNPLNYVSYKNTRPINIVKNNDKESDKESDKKSNSDNISILVNKKNKVSKDYVPKLVSVSGENDKKLHPEAAEAYLKLRKAAKADGVSLWICSGYRTYERQKYNYDNGDKSVIAPPGASEHQTGLAVDFNAATSWDKWINAYPKAWEWLCKNAHKYGFILRYPKGKDDKTEISGESWHWRYIGVEAATKYYNQAPKVKYKGVEYCYYSYEEFLGK